MIIDSDLLKYWGEEPPEEYDKKDENISKEQLNKVEDKVFAFVMSLLY